MASIFCDARSCSSSFSRSASARLRSVMSRSTEMAKVFEPICISVTEHSKSRIVPSLHRCLASNTVPSSGKDILPPLIDYFGSIGRRVYERHRLAYQLVPFVSEEPEGRAVRIPDHGDAFRHDLQQKYAVRCLLEEDSKPFLALAQRLFRLLALGDVPQKRPQTAHHPLADTERSLQHQ